MSKLILEEESYVLIGVLFETYNELGNIEYQEKHFQRALELKLKQKEISFESQKEIKIKFASGEIGNFYIDLIVGEKEKQILLELKRGKSITIYDVRQILQYLYTTGLKLGIIANATRNNKLVYKRVLNNKI